MAIIEVKYNYDGYTKDMLREEAMDIFRQYREEGFFSLEAVEKLKVEHELLYKKLKEHKVKLDRLYKETKRIDFEERING